MLAKPIRPPPIGQFNRDAPQKWYFNSLLSTRLHFRYQISEFQNTKNQAHIQVHRPSIMKRICSSCFEDNDLRAWIRSKGGPRGCDACGKYDSPTAKFDDVVKKIEAGIRRYYGLAVEQLPYESAEGGYQGAHWDTWKMLDMVQLSLPRDNGDLFKAIVSAMTDEEWCDYDWLALELDEALRLSWERFSETVKHKRRFFFHSTGRDDQDSYTPSRLLSTIGRFSEQIGLVKVLPVGIYLWRARPDISKRRHVDASDFGPPPVEFALQSNRMNPPGIPMLYLASSATTALKETRATESKVGLWRTTRPLRILDLRHLPSVPGIFSEQDRNYRLTLDFLHDFAADIMAPVARDQRVHIDYLPSQVVTEFIRDFHFEGGDVEGIAYMSTVHPRGWNVALFLGPIDLGLTTPTRGAMPTPCLKFERAKWAVTY